ncbi:hypothetical protein DUNSADRAFT_2198 [Dunaliella salina]|uniref:Encoded protein n=1 Tax=Dunaliella salina TaxID=3046 RepID=A0ABQ7GW26_DUNSA|nr:hypothetical protein DUNSADRAFT_2198 [Dunaliella salina]|eukprot:KAF5838813.1 hypothetical protein DUNSADRAFT_2198 [Dunaliella salina]
MPDHRISQPSPRLLNQAISLPGPLDGLTDGTQSPRDKVHTSATKSAGSGPAGLSPPRMTSRPPQAPFQRNMAPPHPDLRLSLEGNGLQPSPRTTQFRGSASGLHAEQSASSSQGDACMHACMDVCASPPSCIQASCTLLHLLTLIFSTLMLGPEAQAQTHDLKHLPEYGKLESSLLEKKMEANDAKPDCIQPGKNPFLASLASGHTGPKYEQGASNR